MTDMRADDPVSGDEDRLPWLEAVEHEEEAEGPSAAKLIGLVVVGLVAIGLIVGGLFWLGSRGSSGGGDGQIIAAPQGDYKVKPGDPGGMQVEGEGDTAFAASEGADPNARIDMSAIPEAPVPGAQRQAQPPAAQPQTQAQPPAQQPAAPSASIQLGAFSSQAAANRAWTALSGRFAYLSPLNHSVVPVQSNGRTLYRLRASGPDAAGICRRLQVAGEDCALVG